MPTALLLVEQDHNHTEAAPQTSHAPANLHAEKPQLPPPNVPSLKQVNSKSILSSHNTHTVLVLQLVFYTVLFTLGLLFLSDMQLRQYPEHFTTSLFTMSAPSETPLPLGTQGATHWVWHVYGYMLKVRVLAYVHY